MEFRPTFFSITGFLIPGIVLVTLVALEFASSRAWLFAQITGNAAPGNIVTITVIAVALSVCYVVGSVVTEVFQRLYIRGRRCERLFKLLAIKKEKDAPEIKDALNINDRTSAIAKMLLGKKTLEKLLESDLDAREIFAYQQTCGLDLHWFAGRNLMLGGSGLSCVIAGVIAFGKFLASCRREFVIAGAVLTVFGFVAMWIAAYRKARFEEYSAKVAAVSLLNPKGQTGTGEGPS